MDLKSCKNVVAIFFVGTLNDDRVIDLNVRFFNGYMILDAKRTLLFRNENFNSGSFESTQVFLQTTLFYFIESMILL